MELTLTLFVCLDVTILMIILWWSLYFQGPQHRTTHQKTASGNDHGIDRYRVQLAPAVGATSAQGGILDGSRIALYKELYFKIQNLEFHSDILPKARKTLLQLLSEGLQIERSQPRQLSILNIEEYDPEILERFLNKEHNNISAKWAEYVQRRAAGGPPELFDDLYSAKQWIKRHAPVKYVDGAWLSHIHTITTPFDLREVTKNAWQILSEELGDGDLQKNHVFLYRKLLEEAGITLPPGYDADFIHPRHGLDDELGWKAGAAQLLISLFPHEFLPEILGFNLHYELLTMETLLASKELPEFGLSGYYFTLHVSIDNVDSGHTAMAVRTVIRYLEIVGGQEPDIVPEIWRRIQAGYVLSRTSNDQLPLTEAGENLVKILRSKADASHLIHCSSRVKIGHQPLSQWLSPTSWKGTEQCKRDFLDALANARPWVIRGDSVKSLLMKELSWKGRMFGAFTNGEVDVIRTWINSLSTDEPDPETQYRCILGLRRSTCLNWSAPLGTDVAADHPVLSPQPKLVLAPHLRSQVACQREINCAPNPIDLTGACIDSLVIIWFAHVGLLENIVSTPHRTATIFASHVLRILRAESGFGEEAEVVSGLDEQIKTRKTHTLVSIGLEMIEMFQNEKPTSLKDVFENGAIRAPDALLFSCEILALATRPIQNQAMLAGLALAFLDLETAIGQSEKFLSSVSQMGLLEIVCRKRAIFKCMFEDLEKLQEDVGEHITHYAAGRDRIIEVLKLKST